MDTAQFFSMYLRLQTMYVPRYSVVENQLCQSMVRTIPSNHSTVAVSYSYLEVKSERFEQADLLDSRIFEARWYLPIPHDYRHRLCLWE